MPRYAQIGFTLAELVVALAILGVIISFSIPKIFSVQQNSKMKSIAKESFGAMSAAYSIYKLNNSVDGNTNILNLTSYLNYVQVPILLRHLMPYQPTAVGRLRYLVHSGPVIGFIMGASLQPSR
jgi:prepilin-type N-terminal cleavage/methylation domain-containing protein